METYRSIDASAARAAARRARQYAVSRTAQSEIAFDQSGVFQSLPVDLQSSAAAIGGPTTSVPVSSTDRPNVTSIEPTDGQLNEEELASIVDAAIELWSDTELSTEQLDLLSHVDFKVVDLSGWYLGSADGDTIQIDIDGGGHGWFIDPTPLDDSEFSSGPWALDSQLSTLDPQPSSMDLLTTVMHEMGHVLGLPDIYESSSSDDLMYGFLTLGERRLPSVGQAADAIPGSVTFTAFIGTPINIGTLPAGKALQITFDVTVNNPLPQGLTQISNQAIVRGSNFDDVPTNDPDTPTVGDPTNTLVNAPPQDGPQADLSITSSRRQCGHRRHHGPRASGDRAHRVWRGWRGW